LQVDASRGRNDPRKATQLLSMARFRCKSWTVQASVGSKTRSAAHGPFRLRNRRFLGELDCGRASGQSPPALPLKGISCAST
jgi:hypothetical protein